MHMNILITGGTGLIGRALCKALQAEGHLLTVVSRRPETVDVLYGAKITAMATLEAWLPTQKFDAIINLAGEPIADKHWSNRQKNNYGIAELR